MPPTAPILVIDSGLGGLTVARAIRSVLPREDLIYFGDTARLPYGSKSAETITGFVREIIDFLRRFDPKHVVIACNTATALSLPKLRSEFPELAITGVIEPGVTAALASVAGRVWPRVGLIATEATVRAKAYEKAIHRRREDVQVFATATPLLVPIIEEGRGQDDPLVQLALQQYLQPMLDQQIDMLVLGCTHYPILKQSIAKIVGPAVRVIDSAERCAQDVALRLAEAGTLRRSDSGRFRSFVTDDADRFATLAARFLGEPIEPPTRISLESLTGAARPTHAFRQAV